MIRSYRQIIGAPVVGQEDGALLALIQDIIIHPDTGKIEGFWVKPLALPVKNAVLQSDSILEWKKNIYVKDVSELAEAEDIIKIAEILSRDTLYIGNKVKTESEKTLGKVFDLDFNTEKMYLKNLYARKSLLGFKYQPRVFSYDSIIKVLPEYILVKDVEEKKVKEGMLMEDKQPLLDV